MVEALSDQILAVRAEERLEAIADHAVASGTVKRHVAQSHQRRLERMTRDDKRPASAADLTAMGIKVMNSG